MNHILENVRKYHQQYQMDYLNELIEFVKIPNNVFSQDDIQNNAIFLKRLMELRGIKVEILETPTKRPLLFGELFSGEADKTILIYGHYDGVPVEEEEWHSKPFDPVVRGILPTTDNPKWDSVHFDEFQCDEKQEWRIFGRSIADSKNAIIATLLALDSLKAQGKGPNVNLKFLFDGEEEVESPSLARCLETHKEKLKADLVISASGETHQSGRPTVELGIRGMLQFDVTVYTAIADLHSGHFGNFLPNAALRLAHLISTMKDMRGNVTINGFYDEMLPLSESELNIIKDIPRIEEEISRKNGISTAEMEGFSLQELINLPTFNVRGMVSGYIEESARNIIPSKATAEFDVRLVKGMDPDNTFQKIINHMEEQDWTVFDHTPSLTELKTYEKIVKVVKKSAFPATRTALDSSAASYVVNAVKEVFGEDVVVMPSEGGSLPLYLFERNNIPVIGLPTSNYDCNQHTHDENLRVDYFFRGIETFASLFIGKWSS